MSDRLIAMLLETEIEVTILHPSLNIILHSVRLIMKLYFQLFETERGIPNERSSNCFVACSLKHYIAHRDHLILDCII